MRSSSLRTGSLLFPLLLLCALATIPSLADITLGSDARAVAMGGAGLASGDSTQSNSLNPASLADTGTRFSIQWPTVNARMQGASYSDALGMIGNPSLGAKDALDLATSLGKQDTRLDASATMGVLLPKMDLQAKAAMRTDITPNDSFKAWAKSGGTGTPSDDARADVYAGGLVTLPSVGVGFHVPINENAGKVSVGVRLKPVTAYYSHYIIDSTAISADKPMRASEMDGHDYLKQGSFSADMGITYTPARLPNAHLALVVNNLIEPKAITFGDTAPAGLYEKQLAPRSISAGASLVGEHVTLAADLVDLTSAYGSPQLRLGGEVRLPGNILALRGGYSTSTGLTAGVGIGGFGIAYSKNTPIMLSQSITF